MNLSLNGEGYDGASNSDIRSISINADASSLTIGARNGYSVFPCTNSKIDTIKRIFNKESKRRDACVVERLSTSSLVIVVTLENPRLVILYNLTTGSELMATSYPNTILSCKVNRVIMVLCAEEEIYICLVQKDPSNSVWTIKNTPPNPRGIIALSPNSERSLVAYPASQTNGEVQIVDPVEMKNIILITAHDNPIAALTINVDGTLLGSASEKGTVIRVHNIQDAECLYEFRRGYARCVDVYCLSFSSDSRFLATSSSTETVHVFKLDKSKNGQSALLSDESWTSYIGRALVESSSYLSTHVSDMFSQWRSFAICRLPFTQLRNLCAITTINDKPRIEVLSAEGYLYIYDLDVKEGGDCILVKQHNLQETGPESQPLV